MALKDLKPHKVSRDLRGYSVMFYGDIKTGKTTIASEFPKAVLFAFEKGYLALPGVYAENMNSWGDFIRAINELKDPETKEMFETVVIDTADVAFEYAEKYICDVNGVDSISKVPYGQGWPKSRQEFDMRLRRIVQMGYGLVLISHAVDKTFKNEDGTEYDRIVPTLPSGARLVASRMCDIVGYSRVVETEAGPKTYLFMRGTPRFEAGSRFAYTPDKIEFSYENLVKSIADAIDKQAEIKGKEHFTLERENAHQEVISALDFDEIVQQFNEIASFLVDKDANYYTPRILEIVERHLGSGKRVADCTRAQVMLVEIILSEVSALMQNG